VGSSSVAGAVKPSKTRRRPVLVLRGGPPNSFVMDVGLSRRRTVLGRRFGWRKCVQSEAGLNRATTFGYDWPVIRIAPFLLSGVLVGCATASRPVASVDVRAFCQELTKASASSPELIDKDYFANCMIAHGAKP
jgi:hypothetical protein